MNLALRIGLIQVHLAAVLFSENSSTWEVEWAPLIERHLDKTEARMWREDAVTKDGLGLGYLRFGEKFHLGYSGWDEVQRYASRWPSEVERDLRHDIDMHKPGSAEFFSRKGRFFRGWHPWQVLLLITSLGSSAATHPSALRVSWVARPTSRTSFVPHAK